MNIRMDGVLTRIIRETIIESGLDIDEDIVREILSNQTDIIKERMVDRLSTTLPMLGTFRIKKNRDRYLDNFKKLKEENPDADVRDIYRVNREVIGGQIKEERANMPKRVRTSMSLAKVSLIKKTND
jgi:nucleoid DNA-binding protein